MANIKSSKKDIKRIKVRTERNRARMSEIKTLIKKFNSAIESKGAETAADLFRLAQSKISRARGKGLFKANTAARRVSMLNRRLSTLTKAAA